MKILWICVLAAVGLPLMALPKDDGATVKDSTIVNQNKNVINTATNKSSINTGIQARGADIRDSTITNKFTGTVDARNNSNVSVGVKADGADIKNSTITVDNKGDITANRATVKTGVDVDEVRNSKIKTTFNGDINARGANVSAGTVEGDINHKKVTTEVNDDISTTGRSVKIGTVSGGGGAPSLGNISPVGGGASIGNVEMNGPLVREVKTTVGSGSAVSGLKTKALAEVYKDNDGIDPSGTKNVYVDRLQKERALKTGGSVGNTNTADPRIRKVETFVE